MKKIIKGLLFIVAACMVEIGVSMIGIHFGSEALGDSARIPIAIVAMMLYMRSERKNQIAE